jgi:hypothetical protein
MNFIDFDLEDGYQAIAVKGNETIIQTELMSQPFNFTNPKWMVIGFLIAFSLHQ